MKKLNAIEKASYINDRYKLYLKSSFRFEDSRLQTLFVDQLKKEDLMKGPYIDLNLPFERGKSIRQLIDEGVMSKLFFKLGNINFDRPLYAHQEEAIRNIDSGRGAIVTTGTGSGKTECFLYPILNDILKDVEKGKNGVGVRAVFLYPMNALVNDQMDRVRKILSVYPEITFGFYTGDTQEKETSGFRKQLEKQLGCEIPENELISREAIRENPPHLLFTNYSMLEYLLIRPKDSMIFKPELLDFWKFIVLDEAHTYHGALGIELSMLMRRFTALSTKKPRFILTSATLGIKGKSEKDIVHFANNLTSSDFKEQDIIFSKRIPMKHSLLSYCISGADYLELKHHIDDINIVKTISRKYMSVKNEVTKEIIYELLVRDENVYTIYKELKDKCIPFKYLIKRFKSKLKDSELVALIDLINYSELDGIGIFDLKYHSFIRPLSGAFVTLGENPQLSLKKTNIINNRKAFELGNCKYCDTPYIMGRIYTNLDGISYLYQNSEVDIYENYGGNKNMKMDYFLLSNKVIYEENSNFLEECVLCTKCGSIHEKSNLNSMSCDCEDKDKIIIYKVKNSSKDDDVGFYNNVFECPCCGHTSVSGVIKSLNLGKDEGTALVGQILFEALDEDYEIKHDHKKISLFSQQVQENNNTTKIKQYLAFSDSRQQASFAACFFDSSYRRMMQKRLVWKVLEDNLYDTLTISKLAIEVEKIIKYNYLFEDELTSHKKAWVTVLTDLLKVDGSLDGEGLGLYYFDVKLDDFKKALGDEDASIILKEYNLTFEDFCTLVQVVLKLFKVTPAINHSISELTKTEKLEYLEYRRFDNYVELHNSKSKQDIRSFIPIQGKENANVRYVKKVCRCDNEKAIELLEAIFNFIVNLSNETRFNKDAIFSKNAFGNGYQINAEKYVIKNYKKSNYYRCKKCGRLTPYNVHNVCPYDDCEGTLEEVDPDIVLKSNYYRNQYKNMKIERVVIQEHTAQLDRKTALDYQKKFKNKEINILSCSTTFEMGVDIGDLETVFMRNVPPTPANYVQRAGRAGRRKDSSAFILTYCSSISHDYTYFNEPERMISGIINPPYFNVLNRKIINRHLMATSLGFFFKKYPDYFTDFKKLVLGDGEELFNKYLKSDPKELITYIDEKVIPEDIYNSYHNLNWFKEMGSEDEKLKYFILSINKEYELFLEEKKRAIAEDDMKKAAYASSQIKRIEKMNVIESLSKYCVIPKYGFPVDVVDLKVYDSNGYLNDDYSLSRDLKIAISEYAPDSEVIVNKQKITSKYISLPHIGEFTKNYYCVCPICNKVNISLSDGGFDRCTCGADISMESIRYFIEPLNGFKSGITKESSRKKTKRSYLGEISYIGGGIKDDLKVLITKVLEAESSSNDELLVINKSDFYMCPECGYSKKAGSQEFLPEITLKHTNYRQYDCPNETLKKIRIGHKFQTDVVRLNIPLLSNVSVEDKDKALSFLYALLEGISEALEIERFDIDGLLEANSTFNSYDIVLFDNVPGGAGHVKRLMNMNAIVKSLKYGLKKVSQNCCDENTSCYNCLRNYYNQSVHNKLKRKYAIEIIELLLGLMELD